MNIGIYTYIRFSGPTTELEPLVRDFAEALVRNGFGVTDDNLTSLIVLKETELGSFVNPSDFAKSVVRDSFGVIVPEGKEEEDDSGD